MDIRNNHNIQSQAQSQTYGVKVHFVSDDENPLSSISDNENKTVSNTLADGGALNNIFRQACGDSAPKFKLITTDLVNTSTWGAGDHTNLGIDQSGFTDPTAFDSFQVESDGQNATFHVYFVKELNFKYEETPGTLEYDNQDNTFLDIDTISDTDLGRQIARGIGSSYDIDAMGDFQISEYCESNLMCESVFTPSEYTLTIEQCEKLASGLEDSLTALPGLDTGAAESTTSPTVLPTQNLGAQSGNSKALPIRLGVSGGIALLGLGAAAYIKNKLAAQAPVKPVEIEMGKV